MRSKMLQLQEDCFGKALIEPLLSRINIVQQRRATLKNETAAALIWTTPRNGFKGCGVLLEMPVFGVRYPNLKGPDRMCTVSFLVIEDPTINMGPKTGTQQSAEEVADLIANIFHQFSIGGVGILYVAPNGVVPSDDFAGCIGYRVSFELRYSLETGGRVEKPTVTEDAGAFSLACATDGAQIFYSLGADNFPDQPYTGPLNLNSGEVLRAIATKPDHIGSDLTQITVT